MSDHRLWGVLRLIALGPTNLAADLDRVRTTAEAILSATPLTAATRVQVDDRRPKKVTPKTRAEIAATGREAVLEYFDHPNPKRGALARLHFQEREVDIKFIIHGEELSKHRATALEDLRAALLRAANTWRGVAVVRDGYIKFTYAGTFPPRYARLRRPRENARFPQRSLVTFLDPGFAPRADEVKVLTEPPPTHAKLSRHGDLIEVRWAETLDDHEIAQASTWHDCWIRRTVTEVAHHFNELGDEAVYPGNAKPRPPLTLYNPWLKWGFKAVLVTPEGELEESAWEDARSVLKARALPDGSEVEMMWIVVPLREHAIAVHERVVAAGFEAAVYPTSDGDFWDPVPKGPWLSESTDVAAVRS